MEPNEYGSNILVVSEKEAYGSNVTSILFRCHDRFSSLVEELIDDKEAYPLKDSVTKSMTVIIISATVFLAAGSFLTGCDQQSAQGQEKTIQEAKPPTPVSTEVPKKLQLYGRTIDMDKVVEEVGDRKAELARMLTKWRDTIDENNENDKYVDLTSSFSSEYDKLVKLFPEISTENETLLTQGVVMEKGQPNPIPNFPYDPEKYAKLKESQLIPF
jgi:hypothetical protein